MSNDPISIILAILGTIGVLWGAYTAFIKARQENQNSVSQQWQNLYTDRENEVLRLNAKLDAVREESNRKFTVLTERMDDTSRRERIRDDYIQVLRQHIAEGKPPPPPPWPKELTQQTEG